MAVLAFLCSGPNPCRVDLVVQWAVGLTWLAVVAVTPIVLLGRDGHFLAKVVAGAGVVAVATSLGWAVLTLAGPGAN